MAAALDGLNVHQNGDAAPKIGELASIAAADMEMKGSKCRAGTSNMVQWHQCRAGMSELRLQQRRKIYRRC